MSWQTVINVCICGGRLISPHQQRRWRIPSSCCLAGFALALLLVWLVPAVSLGEEELPRPKVVAILPGHGGKDSGAVHRDPNGQVDLIERDVNLAIARRLAARLRNAGYVAVLTRDSADSLTFTPGDAEREVQANLEVANSAMADILVAIHNNGHPDPSISGTETYYCPKREFAEQSRRLAAAIQRHVVSGLLDVAGYQTRDHGLKSADYKPYGCLYTLGDDRNGTFRASAKPGALVEGLFVSNDVEAGILMQEGGQDLIAAAIFDGIQEYFAAGR